ncbi:MAG: hypothetical protein WBB82_15240 [Limnothrix sp.]
MTELLERALNKLQTLSEREQDVIAALILEELEEEKCWDASFASSPDLLAQMAAVAKAEYHAGQTLELDPDTL